METHVDAQEEELAQFCFLKFLGTDQKKHIEKLRRLREETEHSHGRYMKV